MSTKEWVLLPAPGWPSLMDKNLWHERTKVLDAIGPKKSSSQPLNAQSLEQAIAEVKAMRSEAEKLATAELRRAEPVRVFNIHGIEITDRLSPEWKARLGVEGGAE